MDKKKKYKLKVTISSIGIIVFNVIAAIPLLIFSGSEDALLNIFSSVGLAGLLLANVCWNLLYDADIDDVHEDMKSVFDGWQETLGHWEETIKSEDELRVVLIECLNIDDKLERLRKAANEMDRIVGSVKA